MTQELILSRIKQLPDEYQNEVLNFAEFLFNKIKNENNKKLRKSRGGYGSHKGDYIMSEDFDAPLEDFKDYM